MDFLYTTPPIMVTWQTPRAYKVSKIVLKVFREDFGNTCRKTSWLHSLFFSRICFRLGGGGTTPQMLLTVNHLFCFQWPTCTCYDHPPTPVHNLVVNPIHPQKRTHFLDGSLNKWPKILCFKNHSPALASKYNMPHALLSLPRQWDMYRIFYYLAQCWLGKISSFGK